MSVPSITALNTSDVLNWAKMYFSVIVSSMFAAVITTLPAAFTLGDDHFLVNWTYFRMVLRYPCHHGRPMILSAAFNDFILSIPCWFSISANTWTWPLPVSSLHSTNFVHVFLRTNEILVMKLIPCSRPKWYQRYHTSKQLERNCVVDLWPFYDNTVVFNFNY